MKIFCVLFAGILFLGTAAAQGDEAAIRQLYEQHRLAMLNGDTKAMEKQFSDDFVVTNPMNEFLTKREVIDRVSKGLIAMKSFDRKLSYIKIYGDIAVVAGEESGIWGGKMPMAGKPFHLRITGVARKVNGTWVEVARHASIMPPRQEPPTTGK